jgi:hypothetical protein
MFIMNLAAADLLVLLFCLPATVIQDVTKTWFFGLILCKFVNYIQVMFFFAFIYYIKNIGKMTQNNFFIKYLFERYAEFSFFFLLHSVKVYNVLS